MMYKGEKDNIAAIILLNSVAAYTGTIGLLTTWRGLALHRVSLSPTHEVLAVYRIRLNPIKTKMGPHRFLRIG